jgi:hypothetical protein
VRNFLAVALAVFAALPASAKVVFIAPAGGGDGRTADHPLAMSALVSNPSLISDGDEILLLQGVYDIGRSPQLRANNVTMRSVKPYAAILDGQSKSQNALVVRGNGDTVSGLVIRNFTDNGILIIGAVGTKILNNRITDITSSTWSRGAIHGGDMAPGTLVEGNLIQRTGFAGIIFDTRPDGDLSNITIRKNTVVQTCQVQRDCGAIYINGRANRSLGKSIIEDNVVQDFGPSQNETKGIYLDDWASGVIVRRNNISGRGSFAFQVHGGSDNQITQNKVNVAGDFLLYQSNDSGGGRPMKGNSVTRNSTNTVTTKIWGKAPGKPNLTGNRSATSH